MNREKWLGFLANLVLFAFCVLVIAAILVGKQP